MKEIKVMQWPQNLPILTYMSNTTAVKEGDLEERARSKASGNQLQRPVKVSYMNLRWLFQDNMNFIDFASILDTELPFGFYSSKFTKLLLD